MEEPCLTCTEGENWEIPHLLRAFDSFIQNLGPAVRPSKIKRGLFEVMSTVFSDVSGGRC